MEIQEIELSGEKLSYTYCKRCGVWIESKGYDSTKKPTHDKCEEFAKSKKARERATKKVLGLLNTRVRERRP